MGAPTFDSRIAANLAGVSETMLWSLHNRASEDIARVSRHVIGKRVALGLQAALRPHRADHAEFARMVSEKVEAFSAAGTAIIQKSGEANRQILDDVSAEIMTAAPAAAAMSAQAAALAPIRQTVVTNSERLAG